MKGIALLLALLMTVSALPQEQQQESLGDIARQQREKKHAASGVQPETKDGTFLTINGKSMRLDYVSAFHNPNGSDVDVMFSNEPLNRKHASDTAGIVLSRKVDDPRLYAVILTIRQDGELFGGWLYAHELPGGSALIRDAQFHKKIVDDATVAGSLHGSVAVANFSSQIEGVFQADAPPARDSIVPLDQNASLNRPPVKALTAYLKAISAGNLTLAKSYMTPEMAKRWDSAPAEVRQMQAEMESATLSDPSFRIVKVKETATSAEVAVGVGGGNNRPYGETAYTLELIDGKWKVAPDE